jgi:hypothetical protein
MGDSSVCWSASRKIGAQLPWSGGQGVLVARKTSDIAMLLSSRSKSRSRNGGGLTATFIGLVDKVLGRSSKRGRRKERRPQSVSMWMFVGGVLVAFGGGFMIGDRVSAAGPGVDSLRAAGRAPTFVNTVETKPLSPEAFVVAAYQKLPPQEAKQKAVDLTKYLQDQGFAKARPYPWPNSNGSIWVVAVYFDGDQEAQRTSSMLRDLPEDVPDTDFCELRKSDKQEWPSRYSIK